MQSSFKRTKFKGALLYADTIHSSDSTDSSTGAGVVAAAAPFGWNFRRLKAAAGRAGRCDFLVTFGLGFSSSSSSASVKRPLYQSALQFSIGDMKVNKNMDKVRDGWWEEK